MQQKNLIWILIALAVIAGVVYFMTNRDDSDGMSGDAEVQGVVLAVDANSKLFPLEEVAVLNTEEGDTVLDETTYTVYWTDSTTFLLYENGQQIAEEKPSQTDAQSLTANIMVSVEGEFVGFNEIRADVVRILPGNPRGEQATEVVE